jgi:hypothetical protein
MEIEGTLIFDPVPEGTRMGWSWKLEPRGVLRLMRPLVAHMGKRQEETIWANLKQLLGRDASPPPADVSCPWESPAR